MESQSSSARSSGAGSGIGSGVGSGVGSGTGGGGSTTLRMLVERGGKIVTRDEIKAKLWPNDTVVDFDHSINATIKTLRRALGDFSA